MNPTFHTKCSQCGAPINLRDCNAADPDAPRTDPNQRAAWCNARHAELDDNHKQLETARDRAWPS